MCGIIGALSFDTFEKKSEEKIRTEATIFITTQLLQATVERGKDATGISLLWADGNYAGLKMGIPSPQFIAGFGETEKDFEGFLKLWREYSKPAKIFIGHCRKSSVGNSYDNKNNHPLQIGDIIMIHNGTLTNHDKVFDKLGCERHGEVDSEAIGRLLHHYTKGGTEPFTVDMIKETMKRIHGSFSVLAMSGNNPYQLAQFRKERPAEMVLIRPLKTVFIASEKKFLENVLFEYNKMCKLFTPGIKFPYLKKDDVDFKTLPDNSLALWDLTTKIEKDTEISDLYDWENGPLIGEKIWSSYESTTTGGYNRGLNNNYSKKKEQGVGAEVNAKSKSSSSATGTTGPDATDASGLVWSRSLNKFKTQEGINESKEMKAVIVDVEKGEVIPADDDEDEIGLKETTKDKIESLVSASAETEELALNKSEDTVKLLSHTENGAKKNDEVIQIDMTSDPEALKKAEEYVDKGLLKYETDDEAAADIEVSDPSILKALPLYALVNRITKVVFGKGFVAGYMIRKAEDLENSTPPSNKLKRAKQKIRILKTAVKVLAFALEYRTRGNAKEAVLEMFKKSIKDNIESSKMAKLELSKPFTVGDLKKTPLLKEMIETFAATKKEQR